MKRSSVLPLATLFSLRRPTGLAALFLCAAGLSACVDKDGVARDNRDMLPADQQVSTVPWNKPQGWENKSQLGQLASDPRLANPNNN